MVRVTAPGKCILFGEHAVVYGFPAIAIAIDQRISVDLSISNQWQIDGMPLEFNRHPHIEALRSRLWNQGPPLSVKIEGSIPSGSGLGSSAALSVAIGAGLRLLRGRFVNESGDWLEGWSSKNENDVYSSAGFATDSPHRVTGGESVDLDECALLSHAVEAFAQGGLASPIDSSTCAHGGCIMLSSHRIVELGWMYTRRLPTPEGVRTWEIHEVNIPNALEGYWLVVGYTGVHSSTAKQVDLVSSLIKSKPEMKNVLHAIGQVTERGVKYLQEGDLEGVGRSMTENHILLRALGVSCPELEALIDAALPTSLGAKLTGSGGGGCMIALTLNPKETSEAIELAGGRTFISAFGSEGLRCEEYLDSASWNPFN